MLLWLVFIFAGIAERAFAEPGLFEKTKVVDSQVLMNPWLNEIEKAQITPALAIDSWSWSRVHGKPRYKDSQTQTWDVPYDTGRAYALPSPLSNKTWLVKGTGPNPEWTAGKNNIRYNPNPQGEPVSFNGKFGLKESLFDMINWKALNDMGIRLVKPLGMVVLGYDEEIKGKRVYFAREFLVQTRLSNVFSMKPEEALKEIDTAIDKIHSYGLDGGKKLSRSEYYFWLMDEMASTAAKLQKAGYQHGYLHAQQFTLAGELSDLGTGSWKSEPLFNMDTQVSKYPYLGYENQPLLVQNMFYRSDGFTMGPVSPLKQDSKTFKEQKNSLLGVFMKADPKTAEEIKARNPAKTYWARYNKVRESFQFEKPALRSPLEILKRTNVCFWLFAFK